MQMTTTARIMKAKTLANETKALPGACARKEQKNRGTEHNNTKISKDRIR